ncbi:MAG TPA: hypothetical protein VJ888_05270 [Mobilitalea sp.]|nr:hypothetical protein [Mobilitalea sp.]
MAEKSYNKSNYRRPIILSIIAILMMLGGIVICILGIFLMVAGMTPEMNDLFIEMGLPLGSGLLAGASVLVFGIIYLLISIALFSGKKWGWWLAVIMTALSLVSGVLILNIPGIIFSLIVLLYLSTKNTRGWFGV